MPIEPRTVDEIYDDVKTELEDGLTNITNFVPGSFNDQFLRAYAEHIQEAEIKALAGELAGFAEYAGKDLTENDLDQLGISTVEPADVNEYMHDEQLELLAANYNVDRSPGERATGVVEFSVQDDTVEIKEGYLVATEPDRNGNTREFRCDVDGSGDIDEDSTATVTADAGEDTLLVDIIAADVGSEYNVGSGNITHLPNPQPGIQGVTNPDATTGGEDEQSLSSLRSDTKNAIVDSSEGGTRRGLINGIESNATPMPDSVATQEFPFRRPPLVEVLVAGGDEAQLRDLIDEKKPVGVRHELARPTTINIAGLVQTVGESVDGSRIQSLVSEYFDELEIDENFYWSELIEFLRTTSSFIVSIPGVNTYYDTIEEERFTFDRDRNIYELRHGPMGVVENEEHYAGPDIRSFWTRYGGVDAGSVRVNVRQNGVRKTVPTDNVSIQNAGDKPGNDYVVLDGSVTIDSGSTARISYQHSQGEFGSVETLGGDQYTVWEDFSLADTDGDGRVDAIDWGYGGESPSHGERFEISYMPRRLADGDLLARDDEMFDVTNETDITVEVFDG